MPVSWTPFRQSRIFRDVPYHVVVYIHLVDDEGDPLLGVQAADIDTLTAVRFEAYSKQTTHDPLSDPAFAGSWAAVAQVPGLYRFSIRQATYHGARQVFLAAVLDGAPGRTHVAVIDVDVEPESPSEEAPIELILGLLGLNVRFDFTAHDLANRPTEGTLRLFGSPEDVATGEDALVQIALGYTYDGGRLVSVTKALSPPPEEEG